MTIRINLSIISLLLCVTMNILLAKPYNIPKYIMIDQFGYRVNDKKVAVIVNPQIGFNAKDLSGGWMDAGDYNKYVTFADGPVHMLLTACEQNPDIFTNDYNIPESGNGIPDIIDEIKYELEWIKKMQQEDGGVLIKMGNNDYNTASPPSADKRPRYYGPKCSSFSIATAGMFAHVTLVFSQFSELVKYARELENRAAKVWGWYQNNPCAALGSANYDFIT